MPAIAISMTMTNPDANRRAIASGTATAGEHGARLSDAGISLHRLRAKTAPIQ